MENITKTPMSGGVSFIVPIKYYEKIRLELLLNSFSALDISHEVIIINSSGKSISLDLRETAKIKIVDCPPLGIYNAYNMGLGIFMFEWVMFFGYDDLILPSSSELLKKIIESGIKDSHVHVFNVLLGPKLYKPIRGKYGNIIKSWCHQGVVYHKSVFSKYKYDEKYKTQADHFLNIQLVNDNSYKIKYHPNTLSYFDNKGLSQSTYDDNFYVDYPGILSRTYGKLFAILAYFRRSYIINLFKK